MFRLLPVIIQLCGVLCQARGDRLPDSNLLRTNQKVNRRQQKQWRGEEIG